MVQKYRGYQRNTCIDYACGSSVFFLTLCVKPRRPVFSSALINRQIVMEVTKLQEESFWGVYLYCIMPDHIHLIVNPGSKGLAEAVKRFKGRLCVFWRLHGDGMSLWQDGYFDHVLRSSESYTDKCRYVMENPVRAGLAKAADEYEWTGSLAVWTGR